jgi:hypothetical protein
MAPASQGELKMHRFLKSSVLSAAVAATTLGTLPVAEAGERWHRHRDRTGDVVAAGVLGLAAGAIIAGATSRPVYRERVYVDPYPRNYYPPAPAYRHRTPEVVYVDEGYRYSAPEPWTREWFRYCEMRYRTFSPDTGTYRGYDGREHFCVAR